MTEGPRTRPEVDALYDTLVWVYEWPQQAEQPAEPAADQVRGDSSSDAAHRGGAKGAGAAAMQQAAVDFVVGLGAQGLLAEEEEFALLRALLAQGRITVHLEFSGPSLGSLNGKRQSLPGERSQKLQTHRMRGAVWSYFSHYGCEGLYGELYGGLCGRLRGCVTCRRTRRARSSARSSTPTAARPARCDSLPLYQFTLVTVYPCCRPGALSQRTHATDTLN